MLRINGSNTYALYFRCITQLSGYGRYLGCLGGGFRKSNIAVGASYHAERGQRLRLKYGAPTGSGSNRLARDLHIVTTVSHLPLLQLNTGKQFYLYLIRSRVKDMLTAAPRSCPRVTRPQTGDSR
jgi:hypothetical protein